MLDQKDVQDQDAKPETKSEEAPNKERREMLKKLGTYAVYTAPVVIAILTSEKSYAQPAPA